MLDFLVPSYWKKVANNKGSKKVLLGLLAELAEREDLKVHIRRMTAKLERWNPRAVEEAREEEARRREAEAEAEPDQDFSGVGPPLGRG